MFTCIGTSGKEPLAAPSPILARPSSGGNLGLGAWPTAAAAGNGAAPGPPPPPQVDPDAFMSAFKTMLRTMGQQQQQQQPPGDGGR